LQSLIIATFKTPVGWLEVQYDEHFVYRATFVAQNTYPHVDSEASNLIANEITCYFQNPHHRFQLSLKPHGSAYQQRVWNALLTIPTGRALTYGELAQTLQTSPRAIGQACKSNPITLFIPCHRVIGKTSLGGYMGKSQALQYKKALLQHEDYLK
jgi:methylated-DNA-[protein]-cysteine S-methyltransferase